MGVKLYYQDLVKRLRKSLGEEYELRKNAERELESLKKKTDNKINDLSGRVFSHEICSFSLKFES